MNRTSIRRRRSSRARAGPRPQPLACGAGNESSPTRPTRSSGEQSSAAPSTVPAPAPRRPPREPGPPASSGQHRRHRQLRPERLGRRRRAVPRRRRDFAGSDAYLDDDEGELADAKKRCGGQTPIEVPDYISPIAVVFNVDGRRQAQARPRHHRARSSPARSPRGTTRRSRPTTRTPSCRRRRSPPCTARTTRAPPKNFTDYLDRPPTAPGPTEADETWPIKSGEARQGHLRRHRGRHQRQGHHRLRRRQPGRRPRRPPHQGRRRVRRPVRRGGRQGRRGLPARRGPRRHRHGHRHRPHHRPSRAPTRWCWSSYLIACPTYDDQADGRPGQGLPDLRRQRDGQAAAAESAGSAPLDRALSSEATAVVEQDHGQ